MRSHTSISSSAQISDSSLAKAILVSRNEFSVNIEASHAVFALGFDHGASYKCTIKLSCFYGGIRVNPSYNAIIFDDLLEDFFPGRTRS